MLQCQLHGVVKWGEYDSYNSWFMELLCIFEYLSSGTSAVFAGLCQSNHHIGWWEKMMVAYFAIVTSRLHWWSVFLAMFMKIWPMWRHYFHNTKRLIFELVMIEMKELLKPEMGSIGCWWSQFANFIIYLQSDIFPCGCMQLQYHPSSQWSSFQTCIIIFST